MKDTTNTTSTVSQRDAYLAKLSQLAETDIAWFSGWLCADGTIKKDKAATIRFVICDIDPLDKFSDMFGNKVGGPYKPSGFGHKPRYEWGIRGWKAAMILKLCMPWLSGRYRAKALEAIALSDRPKKPKTLTHADVVNIKQELKNYSHGMSRKLAVKYGVSDTMIWSIRTGRSWADVTA